MPEKKLATKWNELVLQAICITNTSPPQAARALAMVHTAMYDAWSVYDKTAVSTTTARYIKRPDKECSRENRRKAFSYAAYRVATDLFKCALPPEKKCIFSDLMCESGYNADDTTMDCCSPQGIGNLIARIVIEYRNGDGANSEGALHFPNWSDYTCFEPCQPFIVPHWGLVKPFALDFGSEFRPGPPAKKNTPEFWGQAAEILHISECLTDKQKVIAEYWSDGPNSFTPAGHWFEIAQFIADKKGYGNSDCIKLYFALGNAMLDASIACWEAKHYYDSARPISVIRELYKGKKIKAWGGPGKGTIEMNGEDWLPYQEENFLTPPSPEHVSVCSTFSKAAAIILKNYTGSDEFGGCTHIERGCSKIEPGITPKENTTLEWATFSCAADEAGMSGLYGGIHFMNGNQHGQKLGKEVAGRVWQKALYYFNN